MMELAIIAVLALLLLGADRLPEAARTVGKGLRDFRRATEDLKDQIETEIYTDETKRRPPVASVPAAPRSAVAAPEPDTVPGHLPGLEPPAAATVSVEAEPAPAPPADPARPPRS